ncbi:MAG: hypothetical protein IJU41_08290 [Clostridia bacterium]|nr:hypothetical protein [Clostridia bacterium]
MKNYVKPHLETVEISLCDVVLTSDFGFALSGDKSAGEATWQDVWTDALHSML